MRKGFTIVELLIVIVVIAILAAITVIGYNFVSNNAIETSLKADLKKAATDISLAKLDTGSYPIGTSGLSKSDGTDFVYTYSNSRAAFCLIATNTRIPDKSYSITEKDTVMEGECEKILINCPEGFIGVPGMPAYSTSDFCVMKYEAKNDGDGNPVSRPSGSPWTGISQTMAIARAATACTGCRLITDREWLTIAANVLSVNSNWSGGKVGSGYVFKGHVNDGPGSALAASSDDSDGLFGMSPSTIGDGVQYNSRRTLTLTNGEVIWDLSGNVFEWVSDHMTGAQPGPTGQNFASREYKDINNWGSYGYLDLSRMSPFIDGVSGFSSQNGIGKIYSNPSSGLVRPLLRGGNWYSHAEAGILSLNLNLAISDTFPDVGFRVTSPPVSL